MKIQSPVEERWNWITHGLGFVLALVGLFLLIKFDSHKTEFSTISVILYGCAMLILYFASTAYHYTSQADLKKKLRVLDHIGIYLLIAGTYSPVTLITLIDSKGILLFVSVWSLAVIGSILKFFFTGRFQIFSIVLYLLMGWLIMLDIEVLANKIGDDGIDYLMYGGIAYTVGIIFYALKRIPFTHVIWHLFVLAGTAFHYVLILKYII
ncbi:hemolysin III family protein [Aquimarina gracilis]|uniref:Hemolysin III family protein n=1 Tax=Aquimarina gracilis TaxID=874422 RepID=A0ABU6A1F3_9FLAO|nr:hemolysin III family protein [Aquimarina gracilis]MEB3347917.1 hemolysin III family protein [Aquimarina gracilis]